MTKCNRCTYDQIRKRHPDHTPVTIARNGGVDFYLVPPGVDFQPDETQWRAWFMELSAGCEC